MGTFLSSLEGDILMEFRQVGFFRCGRGDNLIQLQGIRLIMKHTIVCCSRCCC
jgi:hypothetical protein